MTWKAFLEKRPWEGSVNLRIIKRGLSSFDVVQPLILKYHENGEVVGPDEVAIGSGYNTEDEVFTFLQALMNLAWDEGIRPAQLEDQRNELKAVREHLADFRSLVFGPKSSQS